MDAENFEHVLNVSGLYPDAVDYNQNMFRFTGQSVPRPPTSLHCTLDWQNGLGNEVSEFIFSASRRYEAELLRGLEDTVRGSLVEFGVYQGDRMALWLETLDELGQERQVYGFDSFEGLPPPTDRDNGGWYEGQFNDAAVASVASRLALSERPHAHLIPGWLSETLSGEQARIVGDVAFAMIDVDLYEPTVEALTWVADLLVDGSILGFDDWGYSAQMSESSAFFEWAADHPELKLEFLAAFAWRVYFRVHRR